MVVQKSLGVHSWAYVTWRAWLSMCVSCKTSNTVRANKIIPCRLKTSHRLVKLRRSVLAVEKFVSLQASFKTNIARQVLN